MDDPNKVIGDFLAHPDEQSSLVAMIKLISERRELFPNVNPRESILDIAKRVAGQH